MKLLVVGYAELVLTWFVLENLSFWIGFEQLAYPADMVMVPMCYDNLRRGGFLIGEYFLYCFDPGSTALTGINQDPLWASANNVCIGTFKDQKVVN